MTISHSNDESTGNENVSAVQQNNNLNESNENFVDSKNKLILPQPNNIEINEAISDLQNLIYSVSNSLNQNENTIDSLITQLTNPPFSFKPLTNEIVKNQVNEIFNKKIGQIRIGLNQTEQQIKIESVQDEIKSKYYRELVEINRIKQLENRINELETINKQLIEQLNKLSKNTQNDIFDNELKLGQTKIQYLEHQLNEMIQIRNAAVESETMALESKMELENYIKGYKTKLESEITKRSECELNVRQREAEIDFLRNSLNQLENDFNDLRITQSGISASYEDQLKKSAVIQSQKDEYYRLFSTERSKNFWLYFYTIIITLAIMTLLGRDILIKYLQANYRPVYEAVV